LASLPAVLTNTPEAAGAHGPVDATTGTGAERSPAAFAASTENVDVVPQSRPVIVAVVSAVSLARAPSS